MRRPTSVGMVLERLFSITALHWLEMIQLWYCCQVVGEVSFNTRNLQKCQGSSPDFRGNGAWEIVGDKVAAYGQHESGEGLRGVLSLHRNKVAAYNQVNEESIPISEGMDPDNWLL